MKRDVALIAVVILGAGVAVGTAVARSERSAASAHLPTGFASHMHALGITYSKLGPVDDKSRSAALRAQSAGPVGGRDNPQVIVVRVTFTDTVYRQHGQPVYVNRAALMVIHPNTPVPLTGPRGSPNGSIRSTVVTFVDPDSFSVLRAVSFNTDTHVVPPGG